MTKPNFDLRYITKRLRKDGSFRRIWQRKPYKAVTLVQPRFPGDDNWCKQATGFNEDADAKKKQPVAYGSILWTIATYRESDEYAGTAPKTRSIYERFLRDITNRAEQAGNPPITQINRKYCVDYVKRLKGPSTKRQAAAVLLNLLEVARYEDIIEHNPASKLKIPSGKGRDVLITDADVAKFLKACQGHEHEDTLVIGTQMLRYTGQRPGDLLKLPKTSVKEVSEIGKDKKRRKRLIMMIEQQKTGVTVTVPAHKSLEPFLKRALAIPGEMVIPWKGRNPLTRPYFQLLCQEVREKENVGLGHFQNRDYRPMAVTKLFEARCTKTHVASITGHSLKSIDDIMEKHYWMKTLPQAQDAMNQWEQMEDEESNDQENLSNIAIEK